MRPRQARIARTSAILCAFALAAAPAQAGDVAQKRVLGFSPDGAYFAFQQSGVQDGSGFPDAEVYVIDTARDAWAPGTPVRKLLQSEKASRSDAVKAAMAEAQPILAERRIGDKGRLLASSRKGSQRLAFRRRGAARPAALTLTEETLASKECARFTDRPVKGFTLGLELPESRIVLHRDDKLPDSRGCALRYAISDVIRHEAGGRETYAVLIRMEKHGFEGPDTRYLAVTRRLP
jgi:predicted secreted protein